LSTRSPSVAPLRRAGLADVSAIRTLTRLAYAKWLPLIGREPLPMTADYERAVVAPMIDLHEVNGGLQALFETIPAEDHLLIETLAVHPDHQGNGLGQMLLGHANDLARDLGCREIRLYTNAAFAANIAFYANRGFSEYAREPFPKGGEVVHMRLLL
jgi:GNAT superfamily N-acetyltransferase